MKKAQLIGMIIAAVLFGLTAACSDPAANKPDAVVQEPAAGGNTAAPTGAGVKTYQIDPASKVGFIGSKITGSHSGGFEKVQGQITLVDGNPAGSKVEVTIDTTSLWADNEKLTGHLKSADFFDVESHPEATFSSNEIAIDPEGGYKVTGNLSLHGVTKQISFPVLIDVVEGGVRAKSEFTINRFDFNIVYPGKPDDLIREEVVIQLDLKTVGLTEPAPVAAPQLTDEQAADAAEEAAAEKREESQ